MAELRLLHLLFLWHVAQGTTISNPCTSDAIRQKQIYHPYPLDSGSYVQCDEWGTPLIRRCPELQVWSAEYVTCVYPTWRNDGSVAHMPDSPPGSYNNRNATESFQKTHQYGSNPSVDLGLGHISSIKSEFSWQAYFAAAGSLVGPSDGQGNGNQGLPLPSISNSMPKQNAPGYGVDVNAGKSDEPYQRQELTFDSTANHSPLNSTAEAGSAYTSSSQQNVAGSAFGRYNINVPRPTPLVNSSQFGSYRSNWMSRWMENSQMDPALGSQAGVGRMNPCNSPNVRYIAHESNPNFYYECVGMMAMQRMCSREKVWAQERNQCVTSTYNISSGPCSVHTSSQTAGTPVTLPFPGEPSKYIICYDLNRFEIRSCQAGHRWADQSQQCVTSDSSVPVVSPGGGHDQIRPDICTSSSGLAASFYHSYPPDASRFLQCDELGNVYLRYCGTNKIWKDELKTCVGGGAQLSLFSSSSSTSFGQLPNNITAVNGSTDGGFLPPVWAAGKESSLTISKLTGPSYSLTPRPSGTSPDDNSTQSSGTTDQLDGLNTQTIIVAEIFRIVCPRGYRYIIERAVCSLNQTNTSVGPIGSTTVSGVKCPPNFEWNVQLHLCARRFSTGRSNGDVELVGNGTSGFINSSDNYISTGAAQSAVRNNTHANETTKSVESSAVQRLPSLPAEANPCDRDNIGVHSGFYFPFPNNAAFFVQCDASGVAFVQACPSGLVWNNNLVTCVYKQVPSEANVMPTFSNTTPDLIVSTGAVTAKPETNNTKY